MARPIKETPVLRGKDAHRFLEATKISKVKSAPSKERERIKKNYDALKVLFKDAR